MKPHNIIIGQKVSPEKIRRAKELRQNMTPAEKEDIQDLRDLRQAKESSKNEPDIPLEEVIKMLESN